MCSNPSTTAAEPCPRDAGFWKSLLTYHSTCTHSPATSVLPESCFSSKSPPFSYEKQLVLRACTTEIFRLFLWADCGEEINFGVGGDVEKAGSRSMEGIESGFCNLVSLPTHKLLCCLPDQQPALKTKCKSIEILLCSPL